MASDEYVIGVDGGGTKTRAVALSMDGRVLARAVGDGLNAGQIGAQAAKHNLLAVLTELTRDLKCEPRRVVVGDPSRDTMATFDETCAYAHEWIDPRRLTLTSDVHLALYAFSKGQSAAMSVCGTGSMIVAADAKGQTHTAGGWGHVLGDPGSGYALALDGLRAAIDSWEGISNADALQNAAEKFFSLSTPRALIDFIYSPQTKPSDIARFGRVVLELADNADTHSLLIVRTHMERMARGTAALIARYPEIRHVGLYGGVFEHSKLARREFSTVLTGLCPYADATLCDIPPEMGGAYMALKLEGAI